MVCISVVKAVLLFPGTACIGKHLHSIVTNETFRPTTASAKIIRDHVLSEVSEPPRRIALSRNQETHGPTIALDPPQNGHSVSTKLLGDNPALQKTIHIVIGTYTLVHWQYRIAFIGSASKHIAWLKS